MPRKKVEGRADFILESALNLFAKSGYAKSTMNDVAAEAGVAVGTIYLYFKSKEDILGACAQRFHKVHQKFARSILESQKTPDLKLRAYLLNRFESWEKETASASKTTDLAQAMITAAPEINQAEYVLWNTTIKSILEEGARCKLYRFKSVSKEAKIFIQSLAGFFPMPGINHPFTPTKKEFLDAIQWFDQKWRGHE
ncbi:MAG: TetR/AcrR family transcriptional regulator [Bdellovibrionaceae bacterium]|nr:TetR/AcrR family transcriptional regulator [Pseudobdellovibrionaceae bacterium]